MNADAKNKRTKKMRTAKISHKEKNRYRKKNFIGNGNYIWRSKEKKDEID